MQNQQTRIVGLDYGLARIGVSLSDPTKMLASPYKTVQASKKLNLSVEAVKKMLEDIEREKECSISEIVVGMPLRMSGAVGSQADEVQAFVDELKKVVTCTITLWDERLTTVQAEKVLREANMNRKKRSKVIDNVAATIILQNYLDFKLPDL